MQKVIVQIDWYTKIILTLIVVLLAGLLARPYIEPRIVKASAPDEISVDGYIYTNISAGNSAQYPFYIRVLP